jgi:cysteine sulfinate desulfinase/cysteine desulfurase-like protein
MLLQDKELVNTQLIEIDTNVKEKYLLLQNKGYVNSYISGFHQVNLQTSVSVLDADFFVFSGHKIFGPTGIGVLYGKSDVLEAARPYGYVLDLLY